MSGILRRMFGNRDPDPDDVQMSPEVREALEESAQRLAQAKRIRKEVDQQMAPIRVALRQNGFEPAVRATFQRRHA